MPDSRATVKFLWVAAVVELADDDFGRGLDFWCGATEAIRSESETAVGGAVHLLPLDGSPFLGVQRSARGSGRIRLEVSVASPATATSLATTLGAEVTSDGRTAVTLRSPGGFEFRFIADRRDRAVPGPVSAPFPNQVDQLCIDIPPALYDLECAFWAGLTGWELHDSTLSEFRWLDRPPDLPLRFLLQRLDSSDEGQPTSAHLDIACGGRGDEVSDAHCALGATRLGKTKRWIQMRDPAGVSYCLTPRLPPGEARAV